ncbi:MAG: toxin-antitoxin system YwqK family antitoxin [Cyclobacteriaceae bacterium]
MQFASIYILILLSSILRPDHENTIEVATEIEIYPLPREVSAQKLRIKQGQGILYEGSNPFSGISVRKYDNGQVAEKSNYINGKREGYRCKWFPNGILSYEAYYNSNRLDGVSKTWWVNGNLRSITHNDQGKSHGTQRHWYITGQLFKEQQFNHGQEDGLQKAWRTNGKLYVNYEAKNGRIYGLKRSALCYELQNENVVYND